MDYKRGRCIASEWGKLEVIGSIYENPELA
jgi:hypothetical protein